MNETTIEAADIKNTAGSKNFDAIERKRHQSRIAQRKYRQNVKERLKQLEALRETQLNNPPECMEIATTTRSAPSKNYDPMSDANSLAPPFLPASIKENCDVTLSTSTICNDTTDNNISPVTNQYFAEEMTESAEEHGQHAKSPSTYGAIELSKRFWAMNALHRASRNGSDSVVRLLIERGADVAKHDGGGETAFHLAAENGHHGVVSLLLQKGVDCNIKNLLAQTALHKAVEYGHEAVVLLLLDNLTDVNSTDIYGETALHIAVETGRESMIHLLLNRGADINA